MDRYQQLLSAYKDVSTSGFVLATDDYSTNKRVLAAARTGETIYVQRVTFAITTDNAATQTVQDTAGTPKKLLTTKASPGLVPIEYDFGPDGVALTEGKAAELANSAAGLAYSFVFQAYQRLTATTPGNAVITANIFGQQ